VQDLAARRLESLLDVRSVKPELLDHLRRSTMQAADAPAEPLGSPSTFDEASFYGHDRGVVGFLRRIFGPFLKLLFDPASVIGALKAQADVNRAWAERESDRARRQAEWNALHYEILQRSVAEMARLSLETQALSARVESLSAKVDFNERRVRSLEGTSQGARSHLSARADTPPPAPVVRHDDTGVVETVATAEAQTSDGPRRRRRRRRGRRGVPPGEAAPGVPASALSANDALGIDAENDDTATETADEDDGLAESAALEPVRHLDSDLDSDSRAAFPPPAEPTPPRDEPVPPAAGSFDTDPPER
jgi:hypothetical protein